MVSTPPWTRLTLLVAALVLSLNLMSRHARRIFSSWELMDTLASEISYWEGLPKACFQSRRFRFFSHTDRAPAQGLLPVVFFFFFFFFFIIKARRSHKGPRFIRLATS